MKLHLVPLLVSIVIMAVTIVAAIRHYRRNTRRQAIYCAVAFVLLAGLGAGMYLASPNRSTADVYVASRLLLAAGTGMTALVVGTWICALGWRRSATKTARRVLGAVAGLVAAAIIGSVAWGYWVTPRTVTVTRVEPSFANLPQGFDGYRIVQISDLHLGTYGADTTVVSMVVDSVNALRPDLICFTGDLVNRRTDETLPFFTALGRLQAPDGVLSILGNHDDGHYYSWPDSASKQANLILMHQLQAQMGWQLLDEDTRTLHRGGDSIWVQASGHLVPGSVIVEGKPVALPSPDSFTIWLYHSPSQWDLLNDHVKLGDLTLCGHTHAMQMMFTIGGKRFSPASLVYPRWGGTYESAFAGQVMHVNTGVGMVGPPMRIGVTPEISLITLKRKH